VGASDVFVEFGCGKGRVVLDAARRYRFRRVIGVELSPDLSAVARRVVASENGNPRCHDVRIETADATAFEIPDDMTYAYFYTRSTARSSRRSARTSRRRCGARRGSCASSTSTPSSTTR
jgi:hypothetical protein